MKTVKIIFSQKRDGRVYKTVNTNNYYPDCRRYLFTRKLYLLLVVPLLMSFEYLSPAESVHPPIESMTLISPDFELDTSLS